MSETLSTLEKDLISPRTMQRAAWSLVWLGVLTAGLIYWSGWAAAPAAAFIAPLIVLIGIVGGASMWIVKDPGSIPMQCGGFLAAFLAVALPQSTWIHTRYYYLTDSSAINQTASDLLAHGHNPYTASLAQASTLLHPSMSFWTYLTNGGHVDQLSYPAGAIVLQAPFMVMGFHHAVTDWMDLFSWLITAALLFALFPKALRWVAALLMMSGIFVVPFVNGGTDALFMPFLVLAVWRWDRFGTGKTAGVANWIGPVALGVACSIKQTPWFLVPFLVLGVALEAKHAGAQPFKRAGAYLGCLAGVFLMFNIVFMVWSFQAWLHGSLLPFVEPLVADGQGIVTLALHGLTGGVMLGWLSAAGVLAFVALLVAFVGSYPWMRRAWLFFLPIVLFLPARSLSDYLVDFIPIAILGALSVTPSHEPTKQRTLPQWALAAGLGVPALLAVVALVIGFSSAPLTLHVTKFVTANEDLSFASVSVQVHNASSTAVTPHFFVDAGSGHPSGYWNATSTSGSLSLGPDQTKVYVITPVNSATTPKLGGYWIVDAYTSSPSALSTTPTYQWKLGFPR